MPKSLPFKPLSKKRLYEEVAEQIKQSIFIGRLQPGDRLPSERELCEIFKVGRPTIREALRTLGIMGLVEVRTGMKGSVVRECDINQYMEAMREQLSWLIKVEERTLEELWEVRKPLERGIAHCVARNATPADMKKLETLMERMEASTGDMKAYFRLATDFHRELALMTQNRVYLLIWQLVDDILLKGYVPNLGKLFPEGPHKLLGGNRVLLEAIRSKDPAAIDRAVELHAEAENIFRPGFQGERDGELPSHQGEKPDTRAASLGRGQVRGQVSRK
jgi:GntR family transcriptional repressor for pyruvate dehydrogenase complex